ncbi:beta-galactosidase [Breznakibacter xylanolyticus]|uniref:Beta-galactosidase n=1 Tax=Breznakibacter xylanolyticus TaxID=990 RepID=A0A2W7NEM9_9BACT|nr:glycoside hydrolase family 43 protein [Breznakibacter xylanolyticus]PZX18648.1 beta-galactosidase [Breznakibacter xylanolyticus]
MKHLLIPILALIISLNAVAQQKHYLFSYFINNGQDGLHLAYSTDGLKWEALNNGGSYLTPEIGPNKLMRDPCIIMGADKRFHMVWTSGWTDRVIGYASSKDLINWSAQQEIPVMAHEPEAMNSWAPEVFYDKANKQYLIFWATTIPNRHSPIQMSERENKYNHRMYYVSTRDFKTFSDTQMFYNPDFSVIDCTILEKNRKFYMFLKNENPNPAEKNIRLAVADQAAGPYPLNVSEPITGNYWAEGPTALQVGEYVYVYFDKYRNHQYGAVRSKDMVNWEDVSHLLSMPKGIRHGTVLEVKPSVIKKLTRKTR